MPATQNQYAFVDRLNRGFRTLWNFVTVVGMIVALCGVAQAQGAFAPPPTRSISQSSSASSSSSDSDGSSSNSTSLLSDGTGPVQDANSSSILGGATTPLRLSSGQIIQILEQSPDLVVEVKSQVADHLQQQGTPVDANDISDEMLYGQIATNADLRASISTFLQARGYVSQDDLQSMGSSAEATGDGEQLSLRSSGMRDSSGDGLLDSDAGMGVGQLRQNSYGQQMLAGRSMSSSGTRMNTRGQEDTTASTDTPKVLRQPTPYNLESMRDLYAQIPERTAKLKRFGSEVFTNRNTFAMGIGIASRDTPLDVPLGPDYVVGVGDTLTVNLWGGLTQSITRSIGKDGRVLLPEAGSLQVAGLSLQKAEDSITAALKPQYRDVQVSVTVSRLRSVRVYLTGDVQRPGGYDISSLATPLSVLYAAGGPTSVGSLRVVRHYRDERLLEEIDLYDFLLHGVHGVAVHFESGDTLLVPPAGAQVAVSGAVKRPAIYELKSSELKLSELLQDAGGVTAAAALDHITIDRISNDAMRETIALKAFGKQDGRAAIDAFQVRDGDRIQVAPILPYSERVIYLQGHVARPGRMSYTDGMRLGDVLHSYRDMLPEPATRGEIVRLVPPDLHANTIQFDVSEALIGNDNPTLQPFDTIRIFGRYEVDAPKVSIHGEVMRPGSYPLSAGMTAAQLVRMAGGFKRDALLESADLTSYDIANGNTVAGTLSTVRIGAAVKGGESNADAVLKPGDILTIHQITGWNDIGAAVTIEGQVRFPGSYGFQEGERLSSVLRRAGGMRGTAYPEGAILVREQVLELEQKSRDELERQIETNSAAARLSPSLGSDTASTMQLIKAQQEEVLSELKSHPPVGRQVVHITADIDSWANTPADIELRRDDVLTLPKRPSFVLVTGQVYNATALTFSPGKTAGWYLTHVGGTNGTANRKEIFVIRANGSVVGRRSGSWFGGNVLSTQLEPGDVVVVPQKIIGSSLFWKNLLTTAQLASSIAITAAVASL
jgi:protein involved in polysaccharide export with SLBB domain